MKHAQTTLDAGRMSKVARTAVIVARVAALLPPGLHVGVARHTARRVHASPHNV